MIAALSWATSACWSSTCCLEIESCLLSVFVASEIALRLGEQGLILGQLPLRLGERRLIGLRIDLGEEVALLDRSGPPQIPPPQLASDLGADGDGLEGRDRSERVDGDRHVAERHRRDAHGLWRRPGAAGLCPSGRRGFGVLEFLPGEHRRGSERHDEREPAEQAAAAGRRRRLRRRFGRRRRRGAVGGSRARPPTGLTASFICHSLDSPAWHGKTRLTNQRPRVRPRAASNIRVIRSKTRVLQSVRRLGDKRPAKRRRRLTDAGVAQG